MRSATNQSVKIARMGGETAVVNIDNETTVANAIEMSPFSVNPTEIVLVNGEKIDGLTHKMNDLLDDGDMIQIVGNKAGASEDEGNEESLPEEDDSDEATV